MLTKRRFDTPVDHAAVAMDWQARGYSCREFVDPPGQAWNDFVHTNNELVTVVEGRLEMDVGDATVMAEPGDEVFIAGGAVHSVRNVHAGTTRWLFGYN